MDVYIDIIIKELNLPYLVVEDQLLTHDQLKSKLKDDHLKRIVELRNLEGMYDGILEIFLVDPTKVTTRLREFRLYMKYRSDQYLDWSTNLEVHVEGLCTLKVKEIHDKIE